MDANVRAEYWLKCWIAVANSSNSTNVSSCTNWADNMLKEFDKRFPNAQPDGKVTMKTKGDEAKQ